MSIPLCAAEQERYGGSIRMRTLTFAKHGVHAGWIRNKLAHLRGCELCRSRPAGLGVC